MQFEPGNVEGALATAKSFYLKNITGRVPVKSDTVEFITADNNSAITITGAASIRTTFLNVVGFTELPLVSPASSTMPKASFRSTLSGSSNIEISLMLDLTGSMCDDGKGPCDSGTKLSGLRTAAADLVNIVVQDTQSPYTSKVGLVPFSTRIRVEPGNGDGSLMKKLTNLDPRWTGWNYDCIGGTGTEGGESSGTWNCPRYESVHKVNWQIMPCVSERTYNGASVIASRMDYTDDAPGPGKWLNAHAGDRMPFFYDSSDTANTTDTGQTPGSPASQWNYDQPGGWCEDAPEENVVAPLSSDKTALQTKIGAFTAAGATGGANATAWAWYLLSPKWSSIWTGTSTPGSYADVAARQPNGAPVLRKVAVLMTDGAFNAFRTAKEQDATVISNHAKQLCTNMKAQGIEIFTVGFALDKLTAAERPLAEDMLKSCGTDLSHFYSSLTVPELQAAFRDIALKVTPVRLTQ
jgi:hypothetical protein